jgi:hypothetical protein
MKLALGLSVHTGWAAAVVAGGDWEKPMLVAVGKVVGKPWTVDWKLAVMGAWQVATKVGWPRG